MKYPKDMDNEMIPICNVLNTLPGIHTTFCCYGHGIPSEFYICFRCSNIKSLKKISKAFSHVNCYANYGFSNGDSLYIEVEDEGPIGNPTLKNEVSVRVSIENCLHKYPKTTMTEQILKKIIKRLKNET